MQLRVFIGLAIMLYEPLYHALQIWEKTYCVIIGGISILAFILV